MSSFNIQAATFNAESDMNYQKIRTNTKGGKNVRANLRTQTPRMPLAFDLSVNTNDDGITKYEISLSFRGQDDFVKVATFRDMLKAIDEYNITWATENSVALFGEDLTKKRDLVEDRYNPMLKMAKKVEYAPTVRVKLQTKMDSTEPEYVIFNKEKEEIPIWDSDTGNLDLAFLTRNTDSVLLIEYTGLWVVGKKFGAGWKLVQGKVYTTNREMGYALEDDPDEEDPEVKQAAEILGAMKEVTVEDTVNED